MGSVAMDEAGNIAAGYSLSSGEDLPVDRDRRPNRGRCRRTRSTSPSGRCSRASDPRTAQYGRWGDYSDMTVAEDGCTFYYTQQYYKKTGQWKWATRIVSFQLPGCAV